MPLYFAPSSTSFDHSAFADLVAENARGMCTGMTTHLNGSILFSTEKEFSPTSLILSGLTIPIIPDGKELPVLRNFIISGLPLDVDHASIQQVLNTMGQVGYYKRGHFHNQTTFFNGNVFLGLWCQGAPEEVTVNKCSYRLTVTHHPPNEIGFTPEGRLRLQNIREKSKLNKPKGRKPGKAATDPSPPSKGVGDGEAAVVTMAVDESEDERNKKIKLDTTQTGQPSQTK